APLEALGERCEAGDLSGLVVRRLPPGIRSRYSPGAAIAAIPDWEERIAAAATLVERQDLRLLCGMPSWLLILFERVGRARELAGRPVRDLRDSGRTSVCSSTVASPSPRTAGSSRNGWASPSTGSRCIRRLRGSWGSRPSR